MRYAILACLALTACAKPQASPSQDASPDQSAAALASARAAVEAMNADAAAKYDAALEAWSAKVRKACGLKPGAAVWPKTKREILEQCNEQIGKGLPPGAKFPPLPPDGERTGLQSSDGCRYWVDTYVDTQGVRAKFRCKYDPSMLGQAEWEMIR